MNIRYETPNDYEEVYKLIKEAFLIAQHTDGNEHELVVKLRKGNAFIPKLSLVAEINGEIVGHIMFTKAKVDNAEVVILAPLSVKPKYQMQGIGTALITEGHKIARELGYDYSLVLGSETYYPRLGYEPADKMGIKVPKEFPIENFMSIKLNENASPICGEVIFPKEFNI